MRMDTVSESVCKQYREYSHAGFNWLFPMVTFNFIIFLNKIAEWNK